MYKKNLIKTATLALLIATAGCGKEEVVSTLDTVQEVIESVEEKEAETSVEEVSLPEISVEAEPEIEVEETKIASNGMPVPKEPKTLEDCGISREELESGFLEGTTESQKKEVEAHYIEAEKEKVNDIKIVQDMSPDEIKTKDLKWYGHLCFSVEECKEYFTEEQYEALKPLHEEFYSLYNSWTALFDFETGDYLDMEKAIELEEKMGWWD